MAKVDAVQPPSAESLAAKAGPAHAEVVADLSDIVTQRLEATENWLATQARATGSIQLMGSNDLQQLRWQLEKLGRDRDLEMDQIFVYRTRIKGQSAWTVLYGSFPGRVEAVAALARLPESLKANRPILRTLQGIRAEIAGNQQE